MLIESKIKRPTAPIEMPDGTIYFFKPLDGNPQSPHVCEVPNEAHIDRLLSISECYRVARTPAVAPIARAPAPAPASQGVQLTPEQLADLAAGAKASEAVSAGLSSSPSGDQDPPPPPSDHKERIAALVASSVPDIRAAVGGITDAALLRGFLEAENATEKPRSTVVQAITNRINALPPVAIL